MINTLCHDFNYHNVLLRKRDILKKIKGIEKGYEQSDFAAIVTYYYFGSSNFIEKVQKSIRIIIFHL